VKRKVLASLLVIAVVVALVGAGSWAWFSDTEESVGNTFTAGTLNLQIADNDEGWFDGTPVHASWQSPSGWAPGQTFSAIVRVKNAGTIDATYLGLDWHNLQGYMAFANVIEVTTLKEYVPGVGWIDDLACPGQCYASLVGNGDLVLTLRELMESYIVGSEPQASNPGGWFQDEFGMWVAHLTDGVTGNGYDTVPVGMPAIPAGGTYQMEMGFTFMTSADNTYQGKSCSFDVSFMAAQDLSQLP